MLSRTCDLFIPRCWHYFLFYLRSNLNTIHLHFVSRRTWMKKSLDSALESRIIQEPTACTSVNKNCLEINKLYPIVSGKSITTKYGPTVLPSIWESEESIVQIFLLKRYCAVISDVDMEKINSKTVSLNLVYNGICETSKSYLLVIES